MPYEKTSDLPKSITDNLPPHAQKIYLASFNNALQEYQNPQKRFRGGSPEQTAHKVAWTAVKKKYTKKENQWKDKNYKDDDPSYKNMPIHQSDQK